MALPTTSNPNGKKGAKNAKGNVAGSKITAKPGKAASSFTKKPVKTGGTRGS